MVPIAFAFMSLSACAFLGYVFTQFYREMKRSVALGCAKDEPQEALQMNACEVRQIESLDLGPILVAPITRQSDVRNSHNSPLKGTV